MEGPKVREMKKSERVCNVRTDGIDWTEEREGSKVQDDERRMHHDNGRQANGQSNKDRDYMWACPCVLLLY